MKTVRIAASIGLLSIAAAAVTPVESRASEGDAAAGLTEQEMRRGKILFLQCSACHALTPGDNQGKIGPSLASVFGREAGSADFYSGYSSALMQAEHEWNRETMDRWLADPAAMVPGTSMVFAGIRDAEQRALLVRYLEAVTTPSQPTAVTLELDPGDTFRECPDCPEMVIIPPGSFSMGHDGGLEERYEGPVRDIDIDYSFAIGRFEVTQAQYRFFIETSRYEPSPGCYLWDGEGAPFIDAHGWEDPDYGRPPADDEPVACLNWTHANAYVEWLSDYTGEPYRLVSEAEWEYVARAGRPAALTYAGGDSEAAICEYANVLDQSFARAHPDLSLPPAPCDDGYPGVAPVGQLTPNPFGVYDMTGNVWEWLQDCYVMPYAENAPVDGSPYISDSCERRAVRGGSWISTLFWQRPTFRGRDPEDLTSRIFGLRVARSLP